MIRSMTAYGAAEESGASISAQIEIRAYNSRFLDIALRIARHYGALEEKIKERIQSRLSRGRVEIRVQIVKASDSSAHLEIDMHIVITSISINS